MPRYPDFLCIGAHKSGTTWLYRMLRQHPDIWLPPLKEITYFSTIHLDGASASSLDKDRSREWAKQKTLEMVRRILKEDGLSAAAKIERLYSASLIGLRELTDAWYGRIFERAATEMLCGEITPAYALLPDAGIEHVLRLCPGVKIFYVMRDPIERAWSDFRMQKLLGTSELDAVLNDPAKSARLVAHCDYMATIERYRKHIPESDLQLLYFDELAQQPRKLLKQVLSFLGVDPELAQFQDLYRHVHKGIAREMSSSEHETLKDKLMPIYEKLRALDTPPVREWRRKHYGHS
jgi:Sulfotransferase family